MALRVRNLAGVTRITGRVQVSKLYNSKGSDNIQTEREFHLNLIKEVIIADKSNWNKEANRNSPVYFPGWPDMRPKLSNPFIEFFYQLQRFCFINENELK